MSIFIKIGGDYVRQIINAFLGANKGLSRSMRNSLMRGEAARLREATGQNWRAYTRYGYVGIAGSGSDM